jgi:hypothetical protein
LFQRVRILKQEEGEENVKPRMMKGIRKARKERKR